VAHRARVRHSKFVRYVTSGLAFEALTWSPTNSADAPLALCLHGYPDTAWTWRHLGPYLAERGWRVVAPYMRGYAPTGLAQDRCYQVGALARDAIEAHGALGGDHRAVLIGHDWGAVATYAVAAHSPELFTRVVTLAIPPAGAALRGVLAPPNLPLIARQLWYSRYMAFQQLPVISERSLERRIPRLWADWSPGYDGAQDAARALEALHAPARRTAAMRYYRALFQPWYRSRRYASEQRAMFGSPKVPTLYMHGMDDRCMRYELVRFAPRALPPGSEIELVERAGHFLQLERPDEINERIAAFISQ
jgi:pimeloyl-ACP methyl ester carboxylesterase